MSDTWESAPLAPAAPAVPAAGGWDSAPLAGPTPQQKAVVGTQGVPDEAARALTIAKQTNIPASVVQSDLPGYDAHAKQQSAVKAVQNPAIAKYVNDSPMAAQVSADDYDKLDEVSQTLYALHPELIEKKSQAGLFVAIPEIAGLTQDAAGRDKLFNALKELPMALGKGILDFFETPGKVASGEVNLSTPQGLDTAIGFGVGVALGGGRVRAGRAQGLEGVTDRGALAGNEQAILRDQAPVQSFDDFMATVRGFDTRKEIDDFLASKQPGPPGAMLQITKADHAAEALSKTIEVAQDSKTKARSPETFAEFGAAHDPGNVHIDAAKVLELYQKEGKVPAEGDGLLGFVPGLAEKMQAAAATGGEVTIPVSQYVAHVDPTVHEGLRESVRLHEDGVTLEEAKDQEKAIEAWHGTPHDFERFDLSKIGTGEGAQVYGHGLYFAENKTVSQGYAEKLAPVTVEGQPYNPKTNPLHALVELSQPGSIVKNRQEYAEMLRGDISDMEASNRPGDKKQIEFYKKKLAILESAREIPNFDDNKGQLYKVSINADPTHFLDWDKPLSEHDSRIQKIVKKLQAKHDLPFNPEFNLDSVTGEQFYQHLKDVLATHKKGAPDKNGFYKMDDGREAASKALAEAGIPGIKYLDQGSRPGPGGMTSAGMKLEKPAPTRNFVVFDDRLVKIIEKNGNPIEALVEAAAETEKLGLGLDTKVFMNMLLKDGKTVGITEGEFKAYSDKIARAEQAILDKAVSVHKAEVARALTPEWKRQEAALTTEITKEFAEQGVFAAERYLRQQKIELGGENLRENADALAPIWGFESGQEMLRALEGLEITKAADRKSVLVQEREAIRAEVAKRMEERHGTLADNIAKEARQIALADHTFDVLADEVRLLAKASGIEPPLPRAEMAAWAKATFERSNVTEAADWNKHRRAVERGGREAEKALLKGDFPEAFQAKQRQMLAATVAKESLALQGLVDSTEKRIDKFQSSEIVNGVDQAATEQFRQVLASIGLPQHFAPLADTPPLRDFVDQSEGQVAAAPWLMDGTQPKLADMTVEQFRALSDTLKSIEHVGRQALKLENAYGEALLANVVGDIVKSLERFPFIDQPAHPSLPQRAASIGRKIVGMHLLVERAMDYTDKFDPHGPLTEWMDRPLRDANAKELKLTEEVVRMLKEAKPFVDASINDKIENKLIPDSSDKSGFLSMTRQDLRNLMLNMGNWSNIKKLAEGYGVNEADLRRFVDTHSSAKDVGWVNSIWKVFEHLKPEADAVQLRDTGVPVDHIPAVPWEVKAGKLNGGYYPLAYDKYNSDIDARIARPLFERGYTPATTPHGYTQERTQYSGAVDLTGAFLSSKIQGMVHDIAFREAVRNADKLIKNQEFRTAVAQYWGKETADLLPGWIRDIANSHNLDDNYAKGFVRAAALIRQNVVSTLIAYNPGTFIKHGFTAMVMSIDRVGLGNLLSATRDLGFEQVPKNIKDMISKDNRLPDEAFMEAFRDSVQLGERGDQARQFVLDSSAVMRNRIRQYEDSIRGAIDALTNVGVAQTLAEFRQRQMQYGRLAVAFSDQMSAMPTWLAAYKKAYQAGETHADSVFIADKEMSRAHGSSFIGDQPAVTRIKNGPTGEVARWFTNLYKFWNHQVNNNFQLAWDASARLSGNSGGEPGANGYSITRRVGYVMAIIMIEEMATAAKDEDHKGLLAKTLLAGLRYFGAGFVGARELTNGLASGYEPSTGMIGTLFKAGSDTVKDLSKATGAKAGLAKDWIKHTATTLGFITGVGGSQIGRTGQFGVNVATGKDRPISLTDWRQGLRTGSSKARRH